jgi:hypothetical protein
MRRFPRMRRPTRRGLVIVSPLPILLATYGLLWFIAAGRIEDAVVAWAQSARAQNIDFSWRALHVGGFPFAFRIEISEPVLHDAAVNPPAELHAPVLTGSARPWDLRSWQLAAPEGLSVAAGLPDQPPAKLTAQQASGTVTIDAAGGATVWLSLADAHAEIGERFAARSVEVRLTLPPHAPQAHAERNIALAADLHELTLPQAPSPFRNTVDELAFGVTVLGAIPNAPPRQAATAWRDAGGTVELDHFALRWGNVAIDGSGTLALDSDLQPIGGFSGAIEGYEELIAGLVAAGRLRQSDARLARIGLAMLAKAGPDGRPQIATSFTIQNGEMFLGPARLGAAPRIAWR